MATDIELKPFYGLEIYINEDGDLVLKQEHPLNNEDAYILIPYKMISTVINGMREVKNGRVND